MASTNGTSEVGNIEAALGATGTGSIAIIIQNPTANAPSQAAVALVQQSEDGVTWNVLGSVTGPTAVGKTVQEQFNIAMPAANYVQINFSNLDPANTTIYTQLSAGPAIPALEAPGEVINLAAGSATETTIPLTWGAPSSGGTVTSYTIQYALTGSGNWQTASATDTLLNYTLSGLNVGQGYDIQVWATNATGSGPAASLTNVLTQQAPPPPVFPSAPTLTLAVVSDVTITATWTSPSTGAPFTGYNLQRSPSGGSSDTWTTIVSSVNELTYSDTGLSPASAYDYRVQAINANGLGAWSTIETATTQAAPALPMVGFDFRAQASFVTDTVGNNFWATAAYPSPLPAASGWGNAGWEQPPSAGLDESATVDPRLAGAVYIGNAKKSNFRVDLPAPGQYTIQLAIGFASLAQSEYVYIYDNTTLLATVASGVYTPIGSFVDASSKVWTAANWPANNVPATLTFATTILRIQIGNAISGATSSTGLAYLSVVPVGGSSGGGTPPVLPSAPINLTATATAGSTTSLTAAWSAPTTGAPFTGYDVDTSPAGAATWSNVASGTAAPPYNIINLIAATKYDIRVRAHNANGVGPYAYVYGTETNGSVPDSPTGLTASNITANGAFLSWVGSSGATSYALQSAPTGTGAWTDVATGIATTSYSVSGLTTGTPVYYRVIAVNSYGPSVPSSVLEVTPTAVVSGGAKIALRGARMSNMHVLDTIVGSFTNAAATVPAGTSATFQPAYLHNLTFTTFDDGASGTLLYLDELNHVRAMGPGTAGTTINLHVVGSSTETGSFDTTFQIPVDDRSSLPGPSVIATIIAPYNTGAGVAGGAITIPFDSNTYTISSMTWASNQVTATTTAPHGYAVGDWIIITGTVPDGYNTQDGVQCLAGTTGSTIVYSTINVASTTNPGTVTTQGTVQKLMVPPTGTAIAQLSVINDPTGIYSAAGTTFTINGLAGSNYYKNNQYALLTCSSSGQIMIGVYWKGGGVSCGLQATNGANTCYGSLNFVFVRDVTPQIPLDNYAAYAPPAAFTSVGTSSTLARTNRNEAVWWVGEYDMTWFYDSDTQGGCFDMIGRNVGRDTVLLISGQLSPGTYNPKVMGICASPNGTCPTHASQNLSRYSSYGIYTDPIKVLDASLPAGSASITVPIPTTLHNCMPLNTVLITPTATGFTDTVEWCVHQPYRYLRYAANTSTGQLTNIGYLTVGPQTLTFVASDGINTCVKTITFDVANYIGKSIVLDPTIVSPVQYETYNSIYQLWNDLWAQDQQGLNNKMLGAQITIKRGPDTDPFGNPGCWLWTENPDNNAEYLYTSGSYTFIGDDPTDPAGRVSICCSGTPGAGSVWTSGLQLILGPKADLFVSNIRAYSVYNGENGNSQFIESAGNGFIQLENCEVYDCDHGVQGGGLGSRWSVIGCLFRYCSRKATTHNMYLAGKFAEVVDCVSHGIGNGGHSIKMRCFESVIVNTMAADLNSGSTSSSLDVPNGGTHLFALSTIEDGPNDQNWREISFDQEWFYHTPNPPFSGANDFLHLDTMMIMCDALDSPDPDVAVAVSSRTWNIALIGTAVNVKRWGQPYGYQNTIQAKLPAVDSTDFLYIGCQTLATRPTLYLYDPATGEPAAHRFMTHDQASPHGNSVNYSIGQNVTTPEIISFSASVPDGTVIATFVLDDNLGKVYAGWAGANGDQPPLAIKGPDNSRAASYWITSPVWSIRTAATGFSAKGDISGLVIQPGTLANPPIYSHKTTGVLIKQGTPNVGVRYINVYCVDATNATAQWASVNVFITVTP